LSLLDAIETFPKCAVILLAYARAAQRYGHRSLDMRREKT